MLSSESIKGSNAYIEGSDSITKPKEYAIQEIRDKISKITESDAFIFFHLYFIRVITKNKIK